MECVNTTQALNTIPSGDVTLPFDATLLFKALQYQLLVAVEYCYDLNPTESLWLEVLGDVTVPGKIQTEVKNYSDSLTDSHSNFWNTLKNWMHKSFERTAFKSLVLLTTQEFGVQSELKNWNKCTATERLKIMERIFAASQAGAARKTERKDAKKSNAENETSKPSKSQLLQQYVMAPEHRDALMEILERMHITTGADSLEQRIKNYQTRHLKTIRPSKYQQFMDDLLGFMCSTKLVSEGWQISHQIFSEKLSELMHRYMKHPKTFPQVDTSALKETIDIRAIQPMLFAQKIAEIDGERYLMRAALHRVLAETIISELYTDGVLFKPAVDSYLRNHLIQHLYGRESSMLDCTSVTCQVELNTRSMKFYLECHAMDVEPFCGMEHTMAEFRNGVYHMLAEEKMEDEDEEFHWRLW